MATVAPPVTEDRDEPATGSDLADASDGETGDASDVSDASDASDAGEYADLPVLEPADLPVLVPVLPEEMRAHTLRVAHWLFARLRYNERAARMNTERE